MHNIDSLIEKFLSREISQTERRVLKKWVLSKTENLEYFKKRIKKHDKNSERPEFNPQEAFEQFVSAIEQKNKTFQLSRFIPYAAAVAVLIGLVIFFYPDSYSSEKLEETLVNKETNEIPDGIVITLGDGTQQVISKDGEASILDEQGNVVGNSKNGQVSFSDKNSNTTAASIFSEIYIPFGQKFEMELGDGTKVWLNSGTRLKFQQNIMNTADDRKVFLEGEAFFEVAKNKDRPFIVHVNNMDVKVLGTQFNVAAYDAEAQVQTTLVEGSVEVYDIHRIDEKLILSPNDQASFEKEKGTISKRKVDTKIYTAWMENTLVVDGLNFVEIMNKLERTYNVSIKVNSNTLKEQKFKGEFPNADLKSILKTISLSTPFNYKINGNEITITE